MAQYIGAPIDGIEGHELRWKEHVLKHRPDSNYRLPWPLTPVTDPSRQRARGGIHHSLDNGGTNSARVGWTFASCSDFPPGKSLRG